MTTIQINDKPVAVEMRHNQSKGPVMRIYENGVDMPPTDIIFVGKGHVGTVSMESIHNQEYELYKYHYLQ